MDERIKRYKKGLASEKLAALYLRLKGYRILQMRYKCKMGEIDIIAKKGNTLIFIEVKARATRTSALESVTPKTMQRIRAAASLYTQSYADAPAMRFDVMGVLPYGRLIHLRAAF